MEELSIFESPISGASNLYRFFLAVGILASGLVLFNHFKNKVRSLSVTFIYSSFLFIAFYYIAVSQEKFYKATLKANSIVLTYPSKEIHLDLSSIQKSQFRIKNYRRTSVSTCRIIIVTNDDRYKSSEKLGDCKGASSEINNLLQKKS